MATEITELVLIRHGETDWNKEHRLQGQGKPGPPLNDLGIQQTQMLSNVIQKRYEHFDAVVCSDLLRTLQTAHILAAGYQLQVQEHPGLRERHIGVLQGLTNLEAPAVQPEAWAALQSGSHDVRIPGGGESLNDVKERLQDTLLGLAAQYPGKRVLVISHGGALHATHRAARGYEAQGKVMNCSISVVRAELVATPQLGTPQPQQQQQLEECTPAASMTDMVESAETQSYSPGSLQSADTPAAYGGLLLASSASQASGYCSSSCCGCCYCMGDCTCAAGDEVNSKDDDVDDDVLISVDDWMDADTAGAAVHAGSTKGSLLMVVWNDTSALLDLEAEAGVGLRAAGFGGSAREA